MSWRAFVQSCFVLGFLVGLGAVCGGQDAADMGALVERLQTGNADQRSQAAVAIGRLGHAGAQAAGDLTTALDDTETRVRANAAWALARIGPAAQVAIPELVGALQDPSTDVSGRAVMALGNLGPLAEDCVPTLMDIIETTDDVRLVTAVAAAIWQITGESEFALPLLLAVLDSPDSIARTNAAGALARVGPAAEKAIEALKARLDDEDEEVRSAARQALSSISGLPQLEPDTHTPVPGLEREVPWPAAPDGPWTYQAAAAAVEVIASRGLSIGLVGDRGEQLNPAIPPDAISLSPDDVAAHATLLVNGNHRTLGDVIEYAAIAGVRLRSTGRTITIEEVLPELQACVRTALATPDAAGSTVGLLLAAGPDLVLPDAQPALTTDTRISPLGALMVLADLLIGIEPGRLGAAPGGLLRMCAADSRWAAPRLVWTAAPDPAERAIKRITGAITMVEADPRGHPLAAAGLRTYRQQITQILRLFESSNRLAVRVKFGPGDDDVLRTVRFRSRNGKIQIGMGTEWRDADTAALTAEVMLVSGKGAPEPVSTGSFEYAISLVAPDDPAGSRATLFDDAHAQLTSGGMQHPRRIVTQGKTALFGLQTTRLENQEYRMALLVVQAEVPKDKQAGLSSKLSQYIKRTQSVLGVTLSEDEENALRDLAVEKVLNLAPWMCRVIFETTGLPDLAIAKVKVSEGTGEATLTVLNNGPGDLDAQVAVEVTRVVDDPTAPDKSATLNIPLSLRAKTTQDVTVQCGGLVGISEVVFRLDPRDRIVEADERNNAATYVISGADREYAFEFEDADCDRFRPHINRGLLSNGSESRNVMSNLAEAGTHTDHRKHAGIGPYTGRVYLTYYVAAATDRDLGAGRRGGGAAVTIEKYPTDKFATGKFATGQVQMGILPRDFRPEEIERRRNEMRAAGLGGSVDVGGHRVTFWTPEFLEPRKQSNGTEQIKLQFEVIELYKNCIMNAAAGTYAQTAIGAKPSRSTLPQETERLITEAKALIDAKRAADPGIAEAR